MDDLKLVFFLENREVDRKVIPARALKVKANMSGVSRLDGRVSPLGAELHFPCSVERSEYTFLM